MATSTSSRQAPCASFLPPSFMCAERTRVSAYVCSYMCRSLYRPFLHLWHKDTAQPRPRPVPQFKSALGLKAGLPIWAEGELVPSSQQTRSNYCLFRTWATWSLTVRPGACFAPHLEGIEKRQRRRRKKVQAQSKLLC